MLLTTFVRAAAALALSLLASCANIHSSNDDPREWSFSPMVEVRKFYGSGLSVEDYVKGKPMEGAKASYVFYLCHGFVEAGDEARMLECRRIYDRIAAEPARKHLNAVIAQYQTYLDIYANQFLLEQGRFKDVEKNLLPFMNREAAVFTFDNSKAANFNYRAIAANILARAQRNMGGVSPQVRNALQESAGAMVGIGMIMNPKGTSVMLAEQQYLLGNYAACYDKVPRSSTGGVGAVSLLGAPLNAMYGGSAAAMERMNDMFYVRLQALCAYEAGRFDDARSSYQELLAQEDVRALRGTQRLAHQHLAQIALRQHDSDGAIKHLKAAVDALESERAALDSEAGRLGYVTNKSALYAQQVELLVAKGLHAEAFEYAERGKARALIDMLASKRTSGQADKGSGAFNAALQAVDDAAIAHAAAPALPGGATRSMAVREQIARANPQLGSLVSVDALPAAQMQRHLKPDETLVEFFGEGARLFAFAVTATEVKAVRLDARAVSEQARAFRQALANASSRDHRAIGERLYDLALAPALAQAGAGPLTIVPHGDLHYVPFAAMHDGRNYLVQKRDIRLLPSASVLPFLNSAPSTGQGLLILGNPDLGNRNLDLPGAEQEARLLGRMNRGSQMLLRGQASETALRRLGPQYRDIHFAMHGKFDAVNAMSSGLYMAKDAENDGVLSVSELYDMQLNADLVVLSACETALGDTSKGNDVVGLNRGFLFAGARSIVSSLWEVDDDATRDLMLAFYQQRPRHGKAGGLRKAQLAMLAKYPHPYYWAAFQMNGAF